MIFACVGPSGDLAWFCWHDIVLFIVNMVYIEGYVGIMEEKMETTIV